MSRLKNILFSLTIFNLISCQNHKTNEFQVRQVNEYYQSTGGLNFLLPEAPTWANMVSEFGCYRDASLRVLDLQKVRADFNTSIRQSLNLQYYYNDELKKIRARFSEPGQTLTLRDYDLTFFKALESSKASFDPLRLPDFNRIHLIIFEEWMSETNGETKLKDFLRNPIQNAGVPVVISFCQPQNVLEEKFQEFGAYSIGAEWVSPFHEDFSPKAGWSLVLSAFFKPHQSLLLFRSNKFSKTDYSKIVLGKYDVK